MKQENKEMQDFLKSHGIDARVKRIDKGSLRETWRLYNPALKWTPELSKKLTGLGFRDFDGKSFTMFSGNGGIFSVFARF